jgi:hypothetical protein
MLQVDHHLDARRILGPPSLFAKLTGPTPPIISLEERLKRRGQPITYYRETPAWTWP